MARLFRTLCYDINANGHPSVFQRLWLRFRYSAAYHVLVRAVIWLHIINAFLEAPMTDSASGTYTAARAINFIVAITLLLHSGLSMYWRNRLDGKVSLRLCAVLSIAVVYLADAIVVQLTRYTTGTTQLSTRLPYTVVLRPIMVVLAIRSIQHTLYDVVIATYRARQVFLLAGGVFAVAVVLVLSLVANNVTSAQEQVASTSGFGFGAFTSTILTMFNFVFTGENFGTGKGCGAAPLAP